jgi:hypothetical protein
MSCLCLKMEVLVFICEWRECKSGYCCLCSVLANSMMYLDERCVLTVVFAMDMISSAFCLRCDGAAR